MPRFTRLALRLLLLTSTSAALAATPLSTQAERSGFVQTGRYDEVIALCDAFAQRSPRRGVASSSAPRRKAGR